MEMIKIARVDGKSKPITDFKGVTYQPVIESFEKYKYPVYTLPENFAQHMISQRPQWYKLLGEKSLTCPIDNVGNATRSWVEFNPWKVVSVRVPILKDGVPVKDEKTGKELAENTYQWVEVKETKE